MLLIVPLSLYIGLATRLIMAHVGYESDEAFYVESAVFMLRGSGQPPFISDPGSWIRLFGRQVPLMIISYVGAAKAFLALPLFAILGISAEVARFSGVLLGALGIAGLVVLIGNEIGPLAGLMVGVALGLHPSYLDFTVFDNGGVSVWMGAMGLIALALSNHLKRQSTFSAFLLGAGAGVGVWSRLNVIWLIASAILAALLVFGRRAIPGKNHIRPIALGGFCGAFPLLVFEVASRLETLRFISNTRQPLSAQRFFQRLFALAELMVSDGEQRRIWSGPPLPPWQIGIGAALLAAVLLSLFVRIPGNPAMSPWRRAFAATAVVLTVIMLTSGLNVSTHHLVAVLPLAMATLAILGIEVASRFRPAIAPLGAAAAGLALLWLSWDARIDRGLRRTGGRGPWSSGLGEIGEYLASHPVPTNRLRYLNWGFQSLYVISGGAVFGWEPFFGATKELTPRGTTWKAEILEGGSFLLFVPILHDVPLSAAAEGFALALRDHRGPLREKLFTDRSGAPLAVLVEILPSGDERSGGTGNSGASEGWLYLRDGADERLVRTAAASRAAGVRRREAARLIVQNRGWRTVTACDEKTRAFRDVPCADPDWAAIQAFSEHGMTSGCGPGSFCPESIVTRDSIAIFLLRLEHGRGHVPPPCTGTFADVPCPTAFAVNWIEQVCEEGIVKECSSRPRMYCPREPVSELSMAEFLGNPRLVPAKKDRPSP